MVASGEKLGPDFFRINIKVVDTILFAINDEALRKMLKPTNVVEFIGRLERINLDKLIPKGLPGTTGLIAEFNQKKAQALKLLRNLFPSGKP